MCVLSNRAKLEVSIGVDRQEYHAERHMNAYTKQTTMEKTAASPTPSLPPPASK
jgi:hypothetical protein